MPDVTIKALDNGSFMVTGDVEVLDADGRSYPLETGKPVFLCRCGQSARKPLCDGSHAREGFAAVERATVAGDVSADEV